MSISQTQPIESAREGTTVEDVFVGDVEEVLTTAGLVVGEYDTQTGYTIAVVGDTSNTQWIMAAEPTKLKDKR